MTISLEQLEVRALHGQKMLLDDMLKSGIPLVYEDEQGRMVRELPDGCIEVIKEHSHAENASDLRA